ncbi:MAG: MarR family transcriptional regulator [Proteobacteria bacterium]|nr:MarR family transcriptional regulator [Pseudomonadota bacterium]
MQEQADADLEEIADGPEELDHDILPELIGYHLRRAQLTVFNDFVGTMAAQQITPGQFGVLALISANPGLSQSALARAVGIERSTMVAVIDALQGRDLLERRPSPVDRRSYALVLSAAGKELLAVLKPLVAQHEDRISDGLTDDEKQILLRLLKKLADKPA